MAIGDFFSGAWKQAKGTVTGTWEAVTNPIDTAKAIGYAVSHPVDTFNAVTSSVGDAFSENPAEATGRAAFEVALLFTPAGLTKVANAAKAAKAARAASAAGKAADTAADVAKVAKAADTGTDVARVADAGADAAKAADATGDAAKTAAAAKGATLSDDILRSIDELPRTASDNFGHWKTKHGPKSPDEISQLTAENAKKVADGGKGKSVTWFADDAAMTDAVRAAPDQLKDVLANNPQKLKEYEQFLANTNPKASFGFRYKVPNRQSVGSGVAGDGTRLANDGTVYIKYQKAQVKGGGLEPQVHTAYPVGQ